MLRSTLVLAAVAASSGAFATAASADSFAYDYYDQTAFHGVFDGPQSASGTIRFYDHAVNGVPACDTGVIRWAAHTADGAAAGGARAVPGGRYFADLPDGGRLTFRISPDGTLVDEFGVSNVHGDTCTFTGGWAAPGWGGTPINVDASSGPSGGGSGAGGGSGGSTGSSGGSGRHGRPTVTRYGARVSFGRQSRARVGGRLRVARSCLAGRTVYLYDGRRRVAKARTHKDGRYSFRVVARRRKRLMRAAVTAKALRGASCTAASSVLAAV